MKPIFKNKYEEMKIKEGTKNLKESATDQTQADEVDLYKCFEKYGVEALIRKTMAQENLYMDCRYYPETLDEAIAQKQDMEQYFNELPARARKVFGDDVEQFYQQYKMGKFDNFLKTGVFNEEQIKALNNERNKGETTNDNTETQLEQNNTGTNQISTGNIT